MSSHSSSQPSSQNEDLERATVLARQAAQAILEVKEEARQKKSLKSDESPVTAADLAADKVLRAGLEGRGDVVVSEEAWPHAELPKGGRVWIVDPLDGTEDFVAGRSDYVVQVGLVVDGQPRLGVICQPETGKLWRGVVGDGFCEFFSSLSSPLGAAQRRSVATTFRGPPRLTASISHPSQLVDHVVRELGATLVPKGSVGLKIGLIVDGEADAYVTGSRRIKVWDTLAPTAVLLAAGGIMTTLTQQKPLPYDAAILHDDGVCAWPAPVKDALWPQLSAALSSFKRS